MATNRRETLQQFGGALAASLAPGLARSDAKAPPRIKIGQVGVGHGHASKLSVYRASADYEVVGIAEPNAALRQRAETRDPYRGLPSLTRDQLLETPGLQAVLVETEVAHLLETAEACVAAGKHVHLDKPAGASLPQFRRLLGAAAKKKLLVQMGYMYRYNPAVLLLRECLKAGWLGELFEAHAVMSKVVGADERKKLARFGGGMMFELGCHVLDLVVGVLGKPKEVAPHLQHVSRLDDGLTDNTLAVLTYPRALATVKSSALEVEGFDRRHLAVCGTEGTFHIQPLDNPSARASFSRPRGKFKKGTQVVELPKFTRYVADAADMARVIRGEKAADFSPEHDLAVQETLLRACGMPLSG
jgi:predicted dehydrogenase